MINSNSFLAVFAAFILTLAAHLIAKLLAKKIPGIPTIITAIVLVIAFLFILKWDYQNYYDTAKPLFDNLLGYVTVLLAVPLASIAYKGLPLKKLSVIILVATTVGSLIPMAMAYGLALSHDTILAFATRSVTTPIGLSIASIINAPLIMANLIIIVAGLVGAGFGRFLFKNIQDDRAKGLAMGMMAHAIGTVEAWQISPTAGRYSAFGLAINGLVTAIWLPLFIAAIS